MLTWKILVAAIGLALVIEGLVYFALPDISRKAIRMLLESNPQVIRWIGLSVIALGLVVFWLAGRI